MTWVICLSEIYKEFSEMNPETDIEILTMSIAQNAYMLNKKHDITIFEKNDYIGGHTHTHAIMHIYILLFK